MKGLFQCPPRASPWVITNTNLSPCKGKSFKDAWLEHDMIQYEKTGGLSFAMCANDCFFFISFFLYFLFGIQKRSIIFASENK